MNTRVKPPVIVTVMNAKNRNSERLYAECVYGGQTLQSYLRDEKHVKAKKRNKVSEDKSHCVICTKCVKFDIFSYILIIYIYAIFSWIE